MALAKVRTKHRRRHRAEAMKFLREAKATTKTVDRRPKVNKLWHDSADLLPVFEFLTS